MTDIQTKALRDALFALQDINYKAFHEKLIPTVPPETVIGIRTPVLRRFASDYAKTPDAAEFRASLPHAYYEENNLHAFLIEKIRDFDQALAALEAFLPYIDNWATCDAFAPKVFAKHTDELLPHIESWIASEKTYTVRYGLGALMRYYLDEHFKPEYLTLAAGVRSEEYYVNMMIAWFFATALAKQYDAALQILLEHKLDVWTHNKAIQKARESFRITDAQKAYLSTLKR